VEFKIRVNVIPLGLKAVNDELQEEFRLLDRSAAGSGFERRPGGSP